MTGTEATNFRVLHKKRLLRLTEMPQTHIMRSSTGKENRILMRNNRHSSMMMAMHMCRMCMMMCAQNSASPD